MRSGERRRPSEDEASVVGATGLLAEVGRYVDSATDLVVSVYPVLWLLLVVRWYRGGSVAPWLLLGLSVVNLATPLNGVDDPDAQAFFLVGGVVPAAVLVLRLGLVTRGVAIGAAAVVLAALVVAIDASDEPRLADVLDLPQHDLHGSAMGLAYREHDGVRFPDLEALGYEVMGARFVELPDGRDAVLTVYFPAPVPGSDDPPGPAVNYVVLTGNGGLAGASGGQTVVRRTGGRRVALRHVPVRGPAYVWTADGPDGLDPRPPSVALRTRAGRTVVAFAWPASPANRRLVERALLEERPLPTPPPPPQRPPDPGSPPLTPVPSP